MGSYNRYFFLTIFLLTISRGHAQDSLKNRLSDLIPRSALKFSPLHLAGVYQSIQFAYERKVVKRITTQLDAGYVLPDNRADYKNKRGVKLKTEWRYYLFSDKNLKGLSYVSAEPYASIINFDRTETVYRCFDTECNFPYSQKIDYLVKYREEGFSIKYGLVNYFDRFLVDFNFGLTLRFIDYIKPEIDRAQVPDGVIEDDIRTLPVFDFTPIEEKRNKVSPIAGLRFGYRFR